MNDPLPETPTKAGWYWMQLPYTAKEVVELCAATDGGEPRWIDRTGIRESIQIPERARFWGPIPEPK